MKDLSIFELRKISEAYERMTSEVGNKQQFNSLEDEYPLLTDDDVLSVVNYALQNGFGQLKIAMVFSTKRPGTYGRRNTVYLDRVGFIDASKLQKIMKDGLEASDATHDLNKALGKNITKYVNDSKLKEKGKEFYSRYVDLTQNNPQYAVNWVIETRFGNEDCHGSISTLCRKVLEHYKECGIEDYLPKIAEKIVRGSKMSYGRDHSEVNMDYQVIETIRRMGDSLGLDVDCEFGEMKSDYDGDDYDMDSEYNAYITFKELHAIKELLKFVATKMFHPAVGRFAKPSDRTYEESGRKLSDILSKFSDRDITGGWYNNKIKLSRKELENDADEFNKREFRVDGAAPVARIISSQNETIEYRMDDYIYKDLSTLEKYVKDGYHCGNCWSTNGYGFFDAGEWVIGMSYFTLYGKVYPEAVNWEETLGTRSSFESEKELNVRSGMPIFEPSLKYVSNKLVIYIHPKRKDACFIA